ncbi:F-box protein CPR1-like [Cornus florida]|uniref:F-box protein CPR1-like n=1 Tax=Cornus florida TaxID=4283 RepID=UPI00289E3F03|nr:F-box protein CPR1-like [Cornus florida]
MGFGFDSLTNDYKVIRIVYFEGPFSCQSPPEVDIFSLSTGIWRNISHLGLQYTIYLRAPQAFLNGAAHWPAYDWRRRGNLIVSFHMGDEVFGEMMVPDSLVHHNWLQGVRVAKFQEWLALIHIKRTDDNNTCCIWVMKEYGIPESWTKLFSIDMSGGLFTNVAGFTRKGEVLFGTKDTYLVAYDPEVEQVKHLHVRGSTDSWYRDSFYADAFTESLVLIREKEPPVLHG